MSKKPKAQTKEEIVDLGFLQKVTNQDTEFEKELYEIFVDSSQNNIDKMTKAIEDEDDENWYMASHSFKGAASSVGAFDLSKTLEEAQVHQSKNYDEKREILENIKHKLSLVLDFLANNLKSI